MQRYTEQDALKSKKLLENTLELLQFSSDLSILIDGLAAYELCLNDLHQLQQFQQELQHRDKIGISQVPKILSNVKEVVAGLHSNHLKYFQVMVEAKEVIEFISHQKGFDEKVRFLNGDLQGYQFGMDLLNNVISVRRFVEPFISALQAKPTLRELCKGIHVQLSPMSEKQFERALQKVYKVLERIMPSGINLLD